MRKAFKIVLIILAAAFIAAQFVRPDLSDPPVVAEQRLEAATDVPGEVAEILARSCADCQTNTTAYPWYSQVSPVSWWLKGHIDEARGELNLSQWGTYSDQKKTRKLEEICDEVKASRMPLPSYTWMHRDSVLRPADVEVLCGWTSAEISRIGSASR